MAVLTNQSLFKKKKKKKKINSRLKPSRQHCEIIVCWLKSIYGQFLAHLDKS
jgi:hypothetical protein